MPAGGFLSGASAVFALLDGGEFKQRIYTNLGWNGVILIGLAALIEGPGPVLGLVGLVSR